MDFFIRRDDNAEDVEDPRRDFLVKALTLGAFALGGANACSRAVTGGANAARTIDPGRSIYRLRGDVRVDGLPATPETRIRPGSRIETGSDAELVFVVGKDAFILRGNSRLELSAPAVALAGSGFPAGMALASAGDSILGSLRLLSGRLLSVFGARQPDETLGIRTPTATIGVRGTGVYVESEADRSYVCTCYGATRLAAVGDPSSRESVTSEYHDAPRYVLGDGAAGKRIEHAPVINHTDMELILIEELVGRIPPFAAPGADFRRPPGASPY
jgi:hypothetical protein